MVVVLRRNIDSHLNCLNISIHFVTHRGGTCNDIYNPRGLDNVLGYKPMVSIRGELFHCFFFMQFVSTFIDK